MMVDKKEIDSYYVENTKFSRIALAQVYEILMGYEDGIENIPERVIRFLEDNMDKEYNFDYGDDLESFKLEKDAENLLIYIYTKYLASEEERNVIESMAKMQKQKLQEKQEKEEYKDIFNNNNLEEKETQENEIDPNYLPVEYKESILKRIINFIKNIFRKK